MTTWGFRAEKVPSANPASPLLGRPWLSPKPRPLLMRRQRAWSFLLLEYGFESDFLETIESGRPSLHLHAQNRAFPGSQQKLGKFDRFEFRIDFPCRLGLSDAFGEWPAPLAINFLQPLSQGIALQAGLQAEIADQTSAVPLRTFEYRANEVEIALQPPPRRKRPVAKGFAYAPLQIDEVAIEDFLNERFLRPEMIGKRTLRSPSFSADVPHTGPVVARPKHHLQAGI